MKTCVDCKYFRENPEKTFQYCGLHGVPTKQKSGPCEKFKLKESNNEQERSH